MFKVELEKVFDTDTDKIFGLFTDGTVFRLTGADVIEYEFIAGRKFSLGFTGRGTIHGTFGEILVNQKIILNWNVSGFGREPEVNTMVTFLFIEDGNNCMLKLIHENIQHENSFRAKESAWSEILADMEKEI